MLRGTAIPVLILMGVCLSAQEPQPAGGTLKVSSAEVSLVSNEANSVKVSVEKGDPVTYTVSDKPAWLNVSSGNNFTTPDTLYFQIASSNCGSCTAALTLHPAGGGADVPVTVRFRHADGPLQTQLAINPTAVNLSSSEARSITVNAFQGAHIGYTVTNAPSWLTVNSTNHFTTPDSLSFQLTNSNCGTCSATVGLLPNGATAATSVAVTYNVNAGSSYRVSTNRVTLSYPGGVGGACGPGFLSSCNVGLTAANPEIKTYSARFNHGPGPSWLSIDYLGETANAVQLARGLALSVNAIAASSLATGTYSGQLVVYNPANQNDVQFINVELLMNPGSLTVSPATGSGSSETFTVQFPHPAGWQMLATVKLLMAAGPDQRDGCELTYEVGSKVLHLADDEGKPGGVNGRCAVRLISAEGAANLLTLKVNLSFAAGFAGAKNIYLAIQDRNQNGSGWQASGTWTVLPPGPPRKRPAPARPPSKK